MKLEVGMFVRTKDGIIDKVIIDYEGHCNNPNCNCKHISCKYNYYDENKVIKASHNIIDLIEVGDYVNGYKVIDMQNLICFNANPGKPLLGIEAFNDYWELVEIDIKSIVTKEQFEQMQYKVDN